MKLLKTFFYSIRLPNKQAMFKLNRIGMDVTVMYLLILLFAVTVPSFTEQITSPDQFGMQMNIVFFLIYFFIFNYLPLAAIVFAGVSLLAYIFTGAAILMRRRVRFPMLWKLITYATTHPFLIYMFLAFWVDLGSLFNLIAIVYILLLTLKLISIYPKRKPRRDRQK